MGPRPGCDGWAPRSAPFGAVPANVSMAPRRQRDGATGAGPSPSRASRVALLHPSRFHLAIVHTSRGLVGSLRTTDASNPLCIRQSRQRSSCRLSQ